MDEFKTIREAAETAFKAVVEEELEAERRGAWDDAWHFAFDAVWEDAFVDEKGADATRFAAKQAWHIAFTAAWEGSNIMMPSLLDAIEKAWHPANDGDGKPINT